MYYLHSLSPHHSNNTTAFSFPPPCRDGASAKLTVSALRQEFGVRLFPSFRSASTLPSLRNNHHFLTHLHSLNPPLS